MKKRRNVPYEVKIEVAKFLIENPNATGRVLKREVEKSLKKKTGRRIVFTERTYQNLKSSGVDGTLLKKTPEARGDTFTERTYQNIKTEMDLTSNELDSLWYIGACLKYQIPSDIVPILIEEQRRLLENRDRPIIADTRPVSRRILTIRQARWFALLQPLIVPLAKEQYPDNPLRQHACLAIYARWYAHTERISELMKQPYPDTSHIDTLLLNGDLSEEALSDGIMEYCGVNKYKEQRAKEMSEWQGYTKEQYEKVLGELNDAQVSLLNEWVRVIGSDSAVSRMKWEKGHKEIIDLVKSKNFEFSPLIMKIQDNIEKQELEQRYGKLSSKQIAMFHELIYSEGKEKWLQEHDGFVSEMQKKEKNNARLNNQAVRE